MHLFPHAIDMNRMKQSKNSQQPFPRQYHNVRFHERAYSITPTDFLIKLCENYLVTPKSGIAEWEKTVIRRKYGADGGMQKKRQE